VIRQNAQSTNSISKSHIFIAVPRWLPVEVCSQPRFKKYCLAPPKYIAHASF